MTALEELAEYGPVVCYMADICIIASEPDGTPQSEEAYMRLENFWDRHMTQPERDECRRCCAALNRWEEEHGIE